MTDPRRGPITSGKYPAPLAMMSATVTVSESPPERVAQLRESLSRRAGEYADVTGLRLGTVSDRCAGDGKFLGDVAAGKNFTVDRYLKAMDWLEQNWPGAEPRHAHAASLRARGARQS